MLKIFFILVLVLQSLWGNFSRTNVTVIDRKFNLMWQDNYEVASKTFTHREGLAYCKSLTLGGYNDWRMPTIKELETIVDKTNEPNHIYRVFRHIKPDGYWASDTLWRSLNFYAWYMNFLSGTPYYYNRVYHKYVRCVRNI
ncbi:DUF1566 domain-containing protein [Arcobacter sp. FWKO B]|uniref:Lcl C-terminal domain-containing protein n=1 Tax=Arcobacter sp. FWKO B TaxID=2593672 RepID=UPI0018A37032|nr:DUF1566 domain-containing protein [Arcobacter sp. FWKO B]QOG12128.1 DUF1566 domain-containing protein [Arcobacter sp. FWKO B]